MSKKLVIWLYDITAHKYDNIKEYGLNDEQYLVVEPLLAGTRSQYTNLLDVATGTGRVPYFLLADGRFAGHITALDPSTKMLDHARTNLGKLPSEKRESVTLIEQEAVPLPFEDGYFEAVTSLESLEFFPDDAAALAEMVRVLKPGGFLMVTRRSGWEARLFLHRYRSADNFKNLLQSLGMNRIDVHLWQTNYDLVTAFKPRHVV